MEGALSLSHMRTFPAIEGTFVFYVATSRLLVARRPEAGRSETTEAGAAGLKSLP